MVVYRRNRSTEWINYFQDMIENEKFNPNSELENECIWFSFSGIIQKDLDFVKEHWNTQRIRDSRHDTDELFSLPEDQGEVSATHMHRLIIPERTFCRWRRKQMYTNSTSIMCCPTVTYRNQGPEKRDKVYIWTCCQWQEGKQWTYGSINSRSNYSLSI